ncbi:hypothetical protein EAO24_20575 [Klebsiella pneumoniae]|nr:hypothetical protein EAO24_20575 [Klebsiella pneumoniae]
MRKSRTPGSVGVSGNGYPYRDVYRRADHASTVRHHRGFPRVHFAQFQGVPVPSHPRLRYRAAPARHPLFRGGS